MGFILVDGELTATEGFVEPVIEQLDIEDDICRLEVSFSGTGDVAVHQGTMLDIPSQGSDDRLLGTVSVRGAHGAEWLAVQQEATYDLDELVVKRHLRSIVPGSSDCSSSSASASGAAELTLTSWTEIGDRVNLRTNADWRLTLRAWFVVQPPPTASEACLAPSKFSHRASPCCHSLWNCSPLWARYRSKKVQQARVLVGIGP